MFESRFGCCFFSPFQLHQGAHPTGKWLIVSKVVEIKEKKRKGRTKWTGFDIWLGSSVGRVYRQYWEGHRFNYQFGYCCFSLSCYTANLNTTRKRKIPLLLSLLFCMLDLILIDIMQNYTWVEGTTFVDIPCTNKTSK